MAAVWILTSMVSRSPQLMHELRKLWYVLDAHDIDLRALYIRSAANVIAETGPLASQSRATTR